MKAINLKVDGLRDPLGLQDRNPRISWTCEGGKKQSAFIYEVYINDEKILGPVRQESDAMHLILPVQLKDRDRARVDLILLDENRKEGEKASCHFEAGISSWEAKWIDPERDPDKKVRQPASYLKREFCVEKTGRSRLYITAHGLYEAYINGRRVGDFVLAPGTDDYGQRIQYQVYDVKDLLQEGDNRIDVIIADGWYRGNNGIDGVNHLFGDDLSLLCQLEIDGKIAMMSDERWFASQDGPIRFSDMEIGEVYDANKEDIKEWHEVRIAAHEYDKLVCSDEVYIKEQERFAGRRIQTPDGSTVYDFSQNLAGYTCFQLHARKGQKLTLWHGETLDRDGNFTQANIDPGKRNQNGGIPQKIEYTCKEGLNIYKPKFSIFGFRYIKVQTDADLSDAKFEAVAVYSDMEETAGFECSNEDVNQLFKNTMWSMKSNFVDIPTDCPQRERSGWTGDAGVFVDTGVILHDSYTVFKKWLAEVRLAQKENGIIRNIAPKINDPNKGFSQILDGSTGWGDAITIVPYALYKTYGDKRILEENYEAMVKWVGFESKLAEKKRLKDLFKRDPYDRYIIRKGFHWGEWCQPDADNAEELKNNFTKGAPKSATAYYFYSTKLLSEIAGILGKAEDEKKYGDLAEKIREAYLKEYTEDGIVRSDRQCDYLRPLKFGMLEKKEENAKLLNEMIVNNGYHLNTGFLSTPFLCPVLCEYGYTDTAYRLLLQETSPSWLYSVKKGATTIWESWKGLEDGGNASLNHYSYGAVSGWLISGVCGIRVNKGKISLAPCPNELLGYAKAYFDSPLGRIVSSWRYEADEIVYGFEIPANAEAELILPKSDPQVLAGGKHEIRIKKAEN
ncbi:MAG: family 78 glycoside hydrolase catalytic domain [Erysipelotrichaceae bacterium]|nr:family 78 glycoside hydrolase catalytic domain [Erysipelotrichaceae bacterium]